MPSRPARARVWVTALVLLGGIAAATGGAAPAAKPDVTLVGDSISGSLDYVPSARKVLTRSFDTTFDLAVCRRLVTAGCAFQGRTPTNALEAVRARGRSLGDILVVYVGYNEGSVGYARGMRRIIRAAQAQGARGVVWVTLREADPVYRPTNGAIRREARRWRSVEVADWEALSRGRPWFREDGLHLNAAGANALARLIRAHVARAVGDPSVDLGPVLQQDAKRRLDGTAARTEIDGQVQIDLLGERERNHGVLVVARSMELEDSPHEDVVEWGDPAP